MACIENVHSSAVAANENGNQEPHSNVPFQCPGSMLNTIPRIDMESWSFPHVPILLRPPFNVLSNLARKQLERPSEKIRSCISVNSLRALQQPSGSSPAFAGATAEINSFGGLAGLRQRRQESINIPPLYSSRSTTLMIGEERFTGLTERFHNSASLYLAFQRSQGFFPPRGPQVRDPSRVPLLRSGIMMDVPLGNKRMVYKEKLAHVSFPIGDPKSPLDNLSRSIPLTFNSQCLPSHPAAYGYTPQFSTFSSFILMYIALAHPPIVSPPHHSYFSSYSFWGIQTPASINKENK